MILEDLELVWQECNFGDIVGIGASFLRKQYVVSISVQGHSPGPGRLKIAKNKHYLR